MEFQLAADTKPTLDDVTKALEAGELPLKPHSYALADLAQQLSLLQPAVWRHRQKLAAKGYPNVDKKLVTAYRLLELTGAATADKLGVDVDTQAQTKLQGELRKQGIAIRDAAVRLARDADQDPRLFSVNFGEGDASNVLPSFHVLDAVLDKHGARLGNKVLLDELRKKTKAAIEALRDAEVKQETGKKDALVPSGTRRKAGEALYGMLLHFSRTGAAVFWDDPETQALFSLKPLRQGTVRAGRDGVDDDDAPVLAPEVVADVDVPEGPLVSIDATDEPS